MSEIKLSPPKTDDVIESHTQNWTDEKKAKFADYISKQQINHEPTIRERDHVLVRSHRSTSLLTLRPNQVYRLRQQKINVKNLISEPYHSHFATDKTSFKRKRTGGLDSSALFEHLSNSDNPNFLPSANNAELFDNHTQSLSHDDIARMKAEGKSGDEIIRAVAAASKTFDSKTEFSQEKWLRKKQAKYSTDVCIARVTPSVLLNHIYEKEPKKVQQLRDDTVAQMLQYANVAAGNRTLVVETTHGFLTGTVAYRQGGFGMVLSGHVAHQPAINMMDELDLTPEDRAAVVPFPLAMLPALSRCQEQGMDSETMLASFHDEYISIKREAAAAKGPVDEASLQLTTFQQQQQTARAELYRGMDSLILATHYSPLELLLKLLPFLLPSSPIVVYCATLEPLTRAQEHLLHHQLAINVQVAESWYRHQQILPNRTHPHMSMNASGGYMLTGFVVKNK
jgi:tRNA (adenine-N(1)-)-methyltransferase non-catalytic subunit